MNDTTLLESKVRKYVNTGKLGRQNIRKAIARKLRQGGAEDIEIEETLEQFRKMVEAYEESIIGQGY